MCKIYTVIKYINWQFVVLGNFHTHRSSFPANQYKNSQTLEYYNSHNNIIIHI